MNEAFELIAEQIHKVHCRAYTKIIGLPYWTGGDYSKLDELTKDYDRAFARWHLAQIESLKAELAAAKNEQEQWKAAAMVAHKSREDMKDRAEKAEESLRKALEQNSKIRVALEEIDRLSCVWCSSWRIAGAARALPVPDGGVE